MIMAWLMQTLSFKSWRRVEAIYSAAVGFLLLGCLSNWDTIPVCELWLHVIAPELYNLNTCMCPHTHLYTNTNTHWPQSHGKSHSLSAQAGFPSLITPAECNFTLTCGLLEIAPLVLLKFPLVRMIGVLTLCTVKLWCGKYYGRTPLRTSVDVFSPKHPGSLIS